MAKKSENQALIEAFVAENGVVQLPTNPTKVVEEKPAEKTPRKKSIRHGTVSYYGRLGVLSGLSNDEILEILMDKFPEQDWDKRKNYPAWYRNEVKNKGLTIDKI